METRLTNGVIEAINGFVWPSGSPAASETSITSNSRLNLKAQGLNLQQPRLLPTEELEEAVSLRIKLTQFKKMVEMKRANMLCFIVQNCHGSIVRPIVVDLSVM
jgi:hypothetical protein